MHNQYEHFVFAVGCVGWLVLGCAAEEPGPAGETGGGTSANPCGGLEGEWTVTPTVVQSESVGNDCSGCPAVGADLPAVGLVLTEVNQRCQAEWRPVWGRTGSAVLVSAEGALTSPPLEAEFAWCDWYSWKLEQLTVTDGAAPRARISSRISSLQGDVMTNGRAVADGSLVPGLPPLVLGGLDPVLVGSGCLDAPSVGSTVRALPWDALTVASSQPRGVLRERLVASHDMAWSDPAEPLDADRAAVGKLESWSAALGQTLTVSVDGEPGASVVFELPALEQRTAFSGDALRALYTSGTVAFETLNGTPTLHLTSTSCRAVLAAGLLDVTGKSEIWFELDTGPKTSLFPPSVTARVVGLDGSDLPTTLVSGTGYGARTYRGDLNGATLLGVEIRAQGWCTGDGYWLPDLRIASIAGT